MTDAQAATYHVQYLRWHVRQERTVRRLVMATLRGVYEHVQSELDRNGTAVLSLMLDLTVRDEPFAALIERIYVTVGMAAAEREYKRLQPEQKAVAMSMSLKDRDVPELPRTIPANGGNGGQIQILAQSATWRQRMVQLARSSETAQRISGITAKTKQLVRDVLTRGAEQNWDIRKIGKRLRAVIADPKRALLIARTETTRAASAGTEAGAMTTGIKLNKRWLATADGRTRDDHRAMLSSKPIGPEEKFSVGGVLMRYPGDPAGGAAQCCRCRCALVYVPVTNLFDI